MTRGEDANVRTLHLVQSHDGPALADCRRFSRPGDAVVLIDTGVLVLCDAGWSTGFPDVELACVQADARAHGIDAQAAAPGLVLLTDEDLVRKVIAFRHCLSWR